MADFKIGDEVYIHGFVDEVRRNTVIIKNEGGYFGTVTEEIMPSAQPKGYTDQLRWERDTAIQQLKELGYGLGEKPRTDGDTISRQAAIDAIEEMQIPIMRSEFSDEQLIFTGMSEALAAIKQLPSAQTEMAETEVQEMYVRLHHHRDDRGQE